MATPSPFPAPPLSTPPTPTLTPPPSAEINANPPESSPVSPPAPPPPTTPTPSEAPPASPSPVFTSLPPASTASPPPPTTTDPPPTPLGAPPPSSSAPPPPTTLTPATPLPNSPPPPSPTVATAPPVPPPPSDPQTSPPPPATKTKSPPPSKSSPPSSPPPPVSESQPFKSHPPPPPGPSSTYPPPPSTKPTPQPPSSPQSPKSSPSKLTPSAPPSQASPTVSHLSPPPASSATLGALVPSSSANQPSDNSTAGSPSKGGVPMGGIVAIGLVVGFLILGLILLVVFCIMSKRKRKDFKHNAGYIVPSPFGSSPRSDSNLIVKTAVSSSTPFVRSASGSDALSPHSHHGGLHSRSWFTYQELYEATNGFALEHLLGVGGFGSVYKGVLANGKEIAVKELKIGGSQGEREFQAEVEIISRIHHRHLVSLVGYCIFGSQRLLVYEYVPNQTLYHHLHGENRPVMDWATRIKIVVGAARGIAYLHEDCHPRIIHRDIKSSNILLDNKFEARVADFGLAKLAMDVDTHVSTRVMGTFGYMAPEYATSGKLTDKSDVYSFGVVLLELLTGRKPVDSSQPLGDESLVEWARPLLCHALETGQVEGLVDPRLEKKYLESELFLMTEAAAACVRHSAAKRPRMAQVVRAFDGLSPSDLSNGMRVGQSEIYDSAQQSAEIRWFRRMAFGSQDYSTDYFSNSPGIVNPSHANERPVFSSQQSQNDSSQQQSRSVYFSGQRTQEGPAFSNLLNPDPAVQGHSQSLPFRQPSSENLAAD